MGTAPFTLKLNAAGKSQYGVDTIDVDCRFGQTPIGYSFQIWQKMGSNGAFGLLTTYGDWFAGDINPVIAEMNSTDMATFITTHVVPWFTKQMKQQFGAFVGTASVPVTPPSTGGNTVITNLNIDAIANGTLAALFKLRDTDGDGLPELTKF